MRTSLDNNQGNIQAQLYVVGLSYRKADAEIRGHFSIPETLQPEILERAKDMDIDSLSIVSTCNRTELYSYTSCPEVLIQLLCDFTRGDIEEFKDVCYVIEGEHAVHHLFSVATGLDSQILGDFEIISQMRRGFKRSRQAGMLNAYMERLANAVIQASKRVKNETNLSSGATSVSFAAVQYILARVPYVSEKNLLLFGIGKIGRNTCENLIKHTQNDHITVINRTKTKAEEIAGKDLSRKFFEIFWHNSSSISQKRSICLCVQEGLCQVSKRRSMGAFCFCHRRWCRVQLPAE